MKKLTHKEQVLAIEAIHGKDKFIFHEEFKLNQSDTYVTCVLHGIFKTRANRLKAGHGCPKCSLERVSKNNIIPEEIQLKKIEELHPNKYEICTPLGKRKAYIDVWCKTCLTYFNTTLGSLLAKSGCPNCAIRVKGWSYSNWGKYSESSVYFDSFKIYIIKCYDDETKEEFVKIGKTFNTVKHRFSSKIKLPYNYIILEIIEFEKDQFKLCSELENSLHKQLKEYAYNPLLDFKGKHECYNTEIIEKLKTLGINECLKKKH